MPEGTRTRSWTSSELLARRGARILIRDHETGTDRFHAVDELGVERPLGCLWARGCGRPGVAVARRRKAG